MKNEVIHITELLYENEVIHTTELLFHLKVRHKDDECVKITFPSVTRYPVTLGIDEQDFHSCRETTWFE